MSREIIAALLTVAVNASKHKETGPEHRDRVIEDYEHFLEHLKEMDASAIPDALQPIASAIKERTKHSA